jgi:hypothetical protein
MFLFAVLCLVTGVLPGYVMDGLSPVTLSLLHDRMPVQATVSWLSIVPIAESRSSYNGILVFVFIALSASLAVWVIHRFASHALRRAPAWDCGFPESSPATQYTANSFAQPIRRVFGTMLFRAREHVEMPAPGDLQPARMRVTLKDLAWEFIYDPIAAAVNSAADRLNYLQFQTIRRYLSFVFFTLITLLLLLTLWT